MFSPVCEGLYLITYPSLGLEQITDLERAIAPDMQPYADLL